ncbi:tyrosine-type recombinase/integrase [Streptomyces sp. BE133]|uniref:tyrosine-type recombinase/integrase n=1 Tax=Streptomyces sp. BE133 TaxID=3002523 RepID=UPI002E79C951|nr:tyrosine-type recombinase/integrase [Streptomyces sp. BE133]MEE1805514.1 tyrosine-type recombinase/integrase [Streptomyces sp. BE133]
MRCLSETLPSRLPRFIPRDELDRLMQAVEDLEDPRQRTALLLLRWSGARRGEIARLPVDCLDAYPDGYPRLRIPVGKTYTERMIPLHPQAADALRDLIETAKAANAAARHDLWAQRPVRYVFMRRGKPMGRQFLFADSLEIACRKAGLVDGDGNPTVTAHRFRHTVGTQLAEGGAQIQTIMAILGHRNAQMSATYSHISDPVLKEQYEKVIAAGGRLAGPAAEALLANQLDEQTVHWLKDQLLQDRARTRPLPAHPGRGAMRVRPLPALLEVLHDQRVRTTTAGPTRPRAATRPGRHRTRMAARGRAAHRHHRPDQGTPGRTRRAHRRTHRHRNLQLSREMINR